MRKGFSKEEVDNIHKALRIVIMGKGTVEEGLARISHECKPSENIDYFVHFIKSSKRGIAIARGARQLKEMEEQ